MLYTHDKETGNKCFNASKIGLNAIFLQIFANHLLFNMGSVHSSGLSKAIVVSGGCSGGGRKVVKGGWVWAWWLISDVQVT